NPSIPAALEGICLKALTQRPEDRFSSAKALAEDVEHWLADQPVSAYREPWRDRAGRWMRRHRTLTTSTAAAVLIGLIGLGSTLAVLTSKNRQLVQQTNR